MKYKIMFFLLAILFVPMTLLANNNPVQVQIVQDDVTIKVVMNLEINGTIKLYSIANNKTEAQINTYLVEKTDGFANVLLDPSKDFYIGVSNAVEAITPVNYRSLAKKYFKNSPELMTIINKRSFRYKDLLFMIIYYNKSMTKEGGLTKGDLVAYSN
jgi:hypothetical protein